MDCIPALSCTWNCPVMKNPIYIFLQTLLLMVVLHNAWSVLEPSVFVWALARKHPWCFHSHGKPVLLTFTSAFMWPNSKANLRAHNMFINQLLRTDAEAIIEFLSHRKSKIWQKKETFLGMLCNLNQLRPVILVTVVLLLFTMLLDCRFLFANSVVLNAASKYHFRSAFFFQVVCFAFLALLWKLSSTETNAVTKTNKADSCQHHIYTRLLQ